MKKLRIYVDSSVIGGCCDDEFKDWSLSLFSDFKTGYFKLLLSELIDAEIKLAPLEVKKIYTEFRNCADEILDVTPEVIELANTYLDRNILSQSYRSDALHIALATVYSADLLVSWNFKHIVNFEKIQKFNALNIEMGYKPIFIYSPREVSRYDS